MHPPLVMASALGRILGVWEQYWVSFPARSQNLQRIDEIVRQPRLMIEVLIMTLKEPRFYCLHCCSEDTLDRY